VLLSYLVLWPTLWALWLASDGVPNAWLLLVFIAGAVLMRSAGCVINDYADRHWDGEVARTCNRPLATGIISPKQALGFFVLLCFLCLYLTEKVMFKNLVHACHGVLYTRFQINR